MRQRVRDVTECGAVTVIGHVANDIHDYGLILEQAARVWETDCTCDGVNDRAVELFK